MVGLGVENEQADARDKLQVRTRTGANNLVDETATHSCRTHPAEAHTRTNLMDLVML